MPGMSFGESSREQEQSGHGAGDIAARFDELVRAGKTRSESIRQRLRTRMDGFDPLAAWLDAVANLSELGQTRSEIWLCQFKFRARLLHDRMRLSRWIDWIG